MQKWYAEGKEQAPKVAQAAEHVEKQATRGGGAPAHGYRDSED